jgi:hypothetical protein
MFPRMSTLPEIESAVAELPAQEQWTLLSWLQGRLNPSSSLQKALTNGRKEWLNSLSELRLRTQTGNQGIPLQHLMDELREDRL